MLKYGFLSLEKRVRNYVTSSKLAYQKYLYIYYHKWPGFCWVRYFLSVSLWILYCSYTNILFWSATIYNIFSRSNRLHTSRNLSWWFSSLQRREIEENTVTATKTVPFQNPDLRPFSHYTARIASFIISFIFSIEKV